MDSSSEDEEGRFFDAQEDIASVSEANFVSNSVFDDCAENSFLYDVWIRSPTSVEERRKKFLTWMGLSLDQIDLNNSLDEYCDVMEKEDDGENDQAALISSVSQNEICSSREFCCANDPEYSAEFYPEERFVFRDRNLLAEECENSSTSSPLSHKARETEIERRNMTMNRVKKGWFSKFRSVTCIHDRHGESSKSKPDDEAFSSSRVQRVKVRHFKKKYKELSALYIGQDIQGHEGAILSLKFSPDGQYLASGGEDGVVKLWQVMEDERSIVTDIPEIDPSCIYFTVNNLAELKPLFVDKEKAGISTSLRKTSDSACVIFPPKVFRIVEKPLHIFCGHSDEISDLSWSKKNYLLSSSVDKTVRLWRVGYDNCIKVFPHSNYVTCVQFNPVDENYFISGSIDGKVRIWGISICQVVGWTDAREIVTAVSYRPDGQGGIVGSMTGNCRFYNVSDNHMQLEAQISLHIKKKSYCKKITGFQFFPQDSSKVMVTCADSRVRILQGLNVIGKYKGLRNGGNQISASFTSDGKYIVSACGDSNVYLWNYHGEKKSELSQAKTMKSCEHFSTDASVAVPWGGLRYGNLEKGQQSPFSSPALFRLSQEFSPEYLSKGSATWPEEKLPASHPPSGMHKSQYKFLKVSCQSKSTSHAWGMVIVTASWDGRIKSFFNYGLPMSV